MKLQLFTLASGGAIALSFFGAVPPQLTASAAALGMLPVGFEIGAIVEKRRRPDINAIRAIAAAEATAAGNAGCEIQLSQQRSRLESQANERIIEAVATAKAEAEQRTAAAWQAHCASIEAAAAEVRSELDTVRAEAEKASRNHAAALATASDRARAEAAAAEERHAGEIETLNDRLAKLEATASEYRRRENRLKSGEEWITKFRVKEAEVKAAIRQGEDDNRRHARTIATLQNELHGMQKAAIEQYNSGLQIGAKQGQAAAAETYKTELERRALKIEQLENKIATLETQLKGKADRDRFTSGLPELSEAVAAEKKPLLLEGSQGSGKALAIANAMMAYSKNRPVIAFVLDISEADDPDSSWRRLGVPCTGDPAVFIEFIAAVEANMRSSRAHRNNRAAYDAQPLLFAIVDEASDAFDDCEKEQIEFLKSRLSRLQNQGSKRGVFPILATQDRQIQNMTVKGIKLLTTGSARKHYRILLNDALRENVSAEESERNPDLARYIEAFAGKYVAAIEKQTGRGLQKTAIKHPSHFGLDIDDTVPCRGVERVEIAAAPEWLPASCRAAYAEFAPVPSDGVGYCAEGIPHGVAGVTDTAAEAMPAVDCADLSDVRSPSALAEKHGLSEDDVIALLDSHDEGLSMSKAVTAIASKSSRAGSKYQRARALYLSLQAS